MSESESVTKVNGKIPRKGDKVAIYHRSVSNKGGHCELEKHAKPEVSIVTAVYMEPFKVRVTSGETWEVAPCSNSTAQWETVA